MPVKLVRLPKEKKLVQIGEAAEILGVSIDTIRRWDSAGRLNSSRPDGKNRYFSISELENLKFAAPLPISEAAKRLEVSVSTLRRLEKRGLLKPERTSGGARVYSKNTLENFLNSEYFLKEKEYQDNVLRPLKAVESTEVAEARPVQTEHKILGLVAEENSQKISKLFAFRNSFYFAGLTLATIFVLLVGIITLMFIMMPEETAKLLGYRTNTKTSQVLGVSYPQKDPTLMQDVLHPFSQVSLQIVKKVDPPAYAKVVQENKEQLVLSSDQLIMTDSGLVNNLNAEYVQGKVPGDEVGDLMVLGKNRTIDANVTTAATVTNGVYTTGSYLNPVWITGLTTSRFSSADISQWTNNSGYITGSSTNTLTNKSGDISMWTNNSGYITSSSTLAGLVRSTATGNSYFTGGNLGVGTSSPAFLFDVNGIVNATALYVDGSPYIGSQWTTSGNNIYYTTGNVGIGITSPSQVLDVTGNINISTGSTYKIAGTDVLSGTTLGSSVVTSSLTTVGALASGSIASGFGNISTGNTITTSGTMGTAAITTFTGAGATFTGNVLFGTSTGILSSGGNVGIGTTAPLSKLGVLGNLAIGATYGAFAAPTSGLLVEGNVGVGTTSPLANLHVAGQCVTGDTLLKRRRRKKKRHSGGEGTEPIESDDEILSSLRSSRMTENDGLPRETEGEVWEDVEIKDIKEGDEILTLDEKSGKFVTSKVHALMDMGIQNVFELTTKDGHSIKTTAEHPYLVNTTKESSKNTNFFYHQTFESVLKTARAFYQEVLEGQYIQVKALNGEKIYFSHDGWDHIYTGHISKLEIMSRFFALDKIIPILKLAKTVTKEKSRTEKGTAFWALQGIIEGVWVKVIIRETKDKPKHFYSVIWKGEDHSKEAANAIKKGAVSRLYPRFQDCLGKAGLTFSTFNWKQYNTFVNDLQPVWKKVNALKPGDKIAVADSSDGGPQGLLRGGRVNWSEIASIKKVKREQVFDIEVEGTHNFVGNNIVAHNTILQGLGTTTGLNFRVQDSTGADKFSILDNGNVGIGTTSPGAKLNIVSTSTTGSDFTLTNTGIVTGNVASLVADALTSGTLMDFSADGLTTGKIMNLASTSTVLSTGGLLSLDWSPTGSTTIYATGDLLSVNIGQYGISGNLLNLKDNGSSVFSVSQSAVTTSLPANFTSPGDVSLAYDLNFTNPTASYIKSASPLYLQAGESFNSSNLTLTTYHEGSIILASDNQPATAATSYAVQLLSNLSSSTNSLTYTGLYSLYNVPEVNLTGTSGTVTSVFNSYAGLTATAGIVSNWYGYYAAAPTGSGTVTNKFAFVSESGAGNVGIGTTAPGYLFDVSGTARIGTLNGLIKGTTGVLSAAATGTDYIAGGVGAASQVAYFTGSGVLTGSNNFWFNGSNVGIGTTAPSALFSVGTTSQFQVNSSGAIAAAAGITTSGGYTQSGTTANTFTGTSTFSNATYSALFTGGNVGIGTTSPTAQLELSGSTAIKASGTTWDNPSDIRLKDVLGSYSKGLSEILQVNPVKYSFKEGNGLGIKPDGEHIGIIAQDIQGIFPEAVKLGSSGYLTFQADPVIWASVNAIKDLNTKLNVLTNTPGVSPGSPGVDLTSLEERVKSLEEKISSHPDPETSSGLSGSTPSAETLNQVQGDNIATSSSVIASNSATASSWRESSTDRISDSIATPSASLQNDVIPNPSASLQNDIADLHVAGIAIFDGIVQFIESITARTLIVTQWADFLGQVIFKGDVLFEGRPVFNQDTAGFAVIRKDAQEVEVKFDKEYAELPLVNVSLTLDDNLTDQDKALLSPLELIDRQKAQEELESNVLNGDIKFIITRRTNQGFIIKLNKPATNDLKFSWTALAVKDARVAISSSVIATLSEQSESNGEAISTESGIATSSSTLPLSGTIARNDNVITPTPFPSPTPSPSVQTSPDVGFDSSGVSLKSVQTIKINQNELGFLRVRDIPGAAGNELGQVLPGETYTVLENEMSSKGASQIWYQIEFDRGLIGWVSSAYVTLE